MPFNLDNGTASALACALFVAAYVRGYSGFGFSAIFIAFAALIINPLPLIPVVFACEILMTGLQAPGIRRQIDWRRVLTLWGGAAIALPLSVWGILSLDGDMVQLSVSAIVFVTALPLLFGWHLQRRLGATGHISLGLVSGACNSAGVGGLPVVNGLIAQPIEASRIRATMIVFLAGLDLMTLPLFWAGGLLTRDTLFGIAAALPMLCIGVFLGSQRFQRTTPETFRKFAVLLLLFLAGLGLIRAIV